MATPENKGSLNQATQDLKQLLRRHRNDGVQTFLQSLTPTASTGYTLWKTTKYLNGYSLWKTTKYLKNTTKPSPPLRTPQGTWARSPTEKAQALAEHLVSVFQPYPSSPIPAPEQQILQALATQYQLDPPIPRFTNTDIQAAINHLNPKKIPWLRPHYR
jgi:hypothetical protein